MMVVVAEITDNDQCRRECKYNTVVRYIVNIHLNVSVSTARANKELDGYTVGPYVVKVNPSVPTGKLVTIRPISIQYGPGKTGVRAVSRHWVLTTAGRRVQIVLYKFVGNVVKIDHVVTNVGGGDGVVGVDALEMHPSVACRAVALFETRVVETRGTVCENALIVCLDGVVQRNLQSGRDSPSA